MILQVQGLRFAYNSTPILRQVSFDVRPGELLAILGPNGAGKTTLLKCLNGIMRPEGGSVLVQEHDVYRLRPLQVAKTIGYVAQQSEASRLTVFDAVLMGRKPYVRWSVSDHDLSVVDAALKRLDLHHLSLRLIDQLSGGELQKVSMARALVQEPSLLLLDEPTSSLDLKNQMEILGIIRRVVSEHYVAGVMTMHDLNSALRFADNALLLKEGEIYFAGPVSQVTEEMVEAVYGLAVQIHTVGGQPLVVPKAA
ncbi:ABC transporter ATP-binding protein [Desulfovermiculus halophilus]|uniref:ABC transporter ATP-binding protein n=1 Tax=Desulfovermiculus halophilus TaxID=339722 RepID=UPI000484AD31|nr:ABC transporter ATP-binding protein [Desulfovermiculus halophilus]